MSHGLHTRRKMEAVMTVGDAVTVYGVHTRMMEAASYVLDHERHRRGNRQQISILRLPLICICATQKISCK
jgi:hypothetical protein